MNLKLRAQLMTTDEALIISNLKELVQKERNLKAEIICYLYVVQKRRIFAKYNYSDIYKFCQKHLGYTEAESQRRISAMFLLTELPEIEEKITQGKLSLTSLSMAQSLFRRESKLKNAFTKEEKLELLINLENKSTRECEKELLKHSSEPVLIKEQTKQISPDLVEYKYIGSTSFGEKIQKLKDLRSNKNNELSTIEIMEELIDKAIKEELSMLTPKPENDLKLRRTVSVARQSKNTSYVGKNEKRQVFHKYQNQCSFIDHSINQRCDSQKYLQIDHIIPIAIGGTSAIENLRVLCRAHNQRAAIDKLGFQKMNLFIN